MVIYYMGWLIRGLKSFDYEVEMCYSMKRGSQYMLSLRFKHVYRSKYCYCTLEVPMLL